MKCYSLCHGVEHILGKVSIFSSPHDVFILSDTFRYFSYVLLLFVEPVCVKRDIVVKMPFRCMCVRPDMSRPDLLYLCMGFKIICGQLLCLMSRVEVLFESFIHVCQRSISRGLDMSLDNLLVFQFGPA